MKRIFSLIGIVFVISLSLMLDPSAEGAEEIGIASEGVSTKMINDLLESPRIIKPRSVLEDFIENRTTATRVIINLREDKTVDAFNSLKQRNNRERVANRVHALIERVLRTFDPMQVKTIHRFTYMAGFSAQVTLEGLEALVRDDNVLSIEKDNLLFPNLAQGIPLMNASGVRNLYNGSGVAVAICDTGIDYNHPSLGGGGFPNGKVIGGYDTGDNDNDPMDLQGHGTACAGIAAGNPGAVGDYIGGVAYNAKLYAVKITRGRESSAYDSDLIEGWEWCIAHQYDDPDNPILVVSTSFGGGRYFGSCDNTLRAYAAAAGNVAAAGISLFVSAGNDGYCDSLGAPACLSSVISVGAVYDADLGQNPPQGWVGCISYGSCVGTSGPPCDEKYFVDAPAFADQVATYSNSALFLNLLAPSNWATTTKLGGGYWDTPNGFGGTSAASPYGAGAAAALQSAAMAISGSFLTPGEVKATLSDTGDLLTDEKVGITKPRVNLGQAVASLQGGGSVAYAEPAGVCGGKSPCYSSIQDALDAVNSGTTIKISEGVFDERLTSAVHKAVTLEGGWDASFSVQGAYTTVGSLTIAGGTVVVDALVLQ
ncbi:MAG TPA: S8 family serine peptidase [Deltaproteobacteria bacterium]|nr:S8 family serine peptidase [Deltaproteobacteria bacterium]